MKTEERKVADLRPHPKNSRTHSEEQIAGIAVSIEQYGFNDPIAVDADGQVLAGHGRLQAAKHLGLTVVPCIVLDHLTPEQARAYLIAHNKLSDQAGWDKDLVEAEFKELVDFGLDAGAFGLTEEEKNVLLAPERRDEGAVDDDFVPEQGSLLPRARPGDTWRLGRHVLVCGDATDPAGPARGLEVLGVKKADLLWTDPPYNVDYEGKTAEKLQIENDAMDRDTFRTFLGLAFQSAAECVKEGGCFYVCHASSSQREFEDALEGAGWLVKQQIIWVKDRFAMSRQDYNWRHEPIFYGWLAGAGHYFCKDFTLDTVVEVPRPTACREHPTMKPIELVEKLIENSSRPGEVVLDIFGGSGSTLIACEKAARTCVMVELDPRYCDVIIARWEQFTEESAEKVVL